MVDLSDGHGEGVVAVVCVGGKYMSWKVPD